MAESSNRTNKHTVARIVVVLITSIVIVVATLLSALWRTGYFLPSWVEWKTYAQTDDINGNQKIEDIKLVNRHLNITDVDGNHYVSPDYWLISDVQVGDITNDDTPEIVILAWLRDSETPTYQVIPNSFFGGFSQHILLCDYSDGELETLWSSAPLEFKTHVASLDDSGQLQLTLSDGKITSWKWDDPGFLLEDESIPTNATPSMD